MIKKQKIFLRAFEANAGNITKASEKAKIGRSTFYHWMKEDEEFRQAVEDIQEGLLDLAESMLLKKIKDGDTTSLIFFLKTKGKKRGYIERVEQEQKDVKEFGSEIQIYLPKKEQK